MKQSIVFLLYAFLLSVCAISAKAHASSFLPGTEDVPLMHGLIADHPTVFDSPEGRIVAVQVTGSCTLQEIKTFYNQVLPQLGWRTGHKPMTYLRKHEQLTIHSKKNGTQILLDFILESH